MLRMAAQIRTDQQLVIRLPLHPASWIPPEEELPDLVIDEDGRGEGHGGQPPGRLQGIHPQALVHARGVGEEGSQAGLEDEAEVHEMVLHSLLEDRVFPCFADDEVSPLHNHNGREESCVT